MVDEGGARYTGSCSSYVKFLAHVQKKEKGEGKQTQRKKRERETERDQTYKSTERKLGRRKRGAGRGRGSREVCGKERSASGRQQFLVECWKTSRGT